MSEKQCAICGYVLQLDKTSSLSDIKTKRSATNHLSSWVCPVCHAPEDLFFDHPVNSNSE